MEVEGQPRGYTTVITLENFIVRGFEEHDVVGVGQLRFVWRNETLVIGFMVAHTTNAQGQSRMQRRRRAA